VRQHHREGYQDVKPQHQGQRNKQEQNKINIMPVKKSIYELPESWRDDIKNVGFDYEGKLLKKSLSHEMYKDPTRADLISQWEKVLFEMVESIKTLKCVFDWRKPKNHRKFN
jgi:hypothetical protein